MNQAQITQLVIQTVNGSLSNLYVDKSNITMLSEISANEIIYSGKTLGGNDAKGLWIWVVKNSKLYSITFAVVTSGQISAASEEFERQLPIINHLI